MVEFISNPTNWPMVTIVAVSALAFLTIAK